MIVDKIAAKKTLAVTLALALGLVIPTGAFAQVDARIAPVSASVGAPAAASVVGLQTISLTIPTVAPSLMPGAVSLSPVSARPSAASVAAPSAAYAPAAAPAGAELSAPAPSAFAAAPGSIDAHPVIALINQLQAAGVTLPDGFGTRKDADKIDAAANALPAGSPIRAQLGQIAAMIRTGGEGAGRAFDGARDVVKFEGDLTPGGTPSAPAEPNPASHELTAGQVRYSPSTESLPNGTKAVPSTEQKIVGQDDALEAIRFALEMPGDQYNLFVAGAEGSGRELAIRRILSQIAPNQPVPNDLVSATNFDEKEKPLILELPPGKGKVFEKGVEQFVKNMTESLVEEFSTGETAQQQQKIQSTLEQLSETTMAEFQKHISETKLGTKFNVFFQAMPNKQGHLQLGVAVAYQGKPLTPDTIKAEIQAGAFTQEEFDAAQEELKGKTKGIVAAFQKSMEAVGAQAVKLQGLAQQVQETAAASIVNQHANALLQAVIAGPETPELAAVKQRAEERQAEIQEAFQKAANAKYGKFAVGVTPQGGVVLVFDKQPLNSQQAVEALVAAGKFTAAEFAAAQQQLKTKFAAVQAKAQQYQAQTEREFAAVQATLPKPGPEQAKLIAYIQKLAEFAAKNYPIFVAEAMSEGKTKPGMKPVDAKDFFRVSVLADNGATHGAPVVYEENPTFERLFGAADDNDRNMMIPGVGIMKSEGPGGPTLKGGSYHKANGGYLVVNAMSVLKSPGAWEALMHAVATGKADIEEGGLIGLLSRKGDSYPVPTKVKVVLVGSPMIQMLLEQHDGDFAKSFLGVAQFQSTIKITQEAVDGFLNFLKHSVAGSEGKIIHLTKDAIARVLEQAARMAGSNQNFTAQFGAVHGLLQEATYWAKRSGQTEIRAEDVEKALSAKRDREEGYIKRMREAYEKNIFRVDTKGSAVGQLNGLAVMGSTGVVMRITFVAVPGQPGIVSIDKDAGTTGSSFNKALGVEWSFIVNEFGRENPVRAQIRISHEQNYGGIDGDSATSTTIYGILSALSGVPIQQKFAMTGSADQFGNVQAIGGVNEKIEGFFAICKSRGLTGDQGVIIPKTNVADLQLSPEVAAAIAEGRFHIYAVDHVSQGIEILTGRPYSEIKEKAQARINEISESLQKLAGGPGVGGNGGANGGANGGVAHN